MEKVAHLLYCPMTGLGLYGGHRGSRWLKNRIKIFKQFVLPSLKAQTNQNFILWMSFRHEDRQDSTVRGFQSFLEKELSCVFTFSGVAFWDDKYPDDTARERLISAIHGAMGEILNTVGEASAILMTIQPSDDCYHKGAVEEIQGMFKNTDTQAVGYKSGYVMDYIDLKIAEWNPKTNPPFYTIKFPREIFQDPPKHINYTGPYKSHEYVGDYLKYLPIYERGFLVGTHGENISTIFNHPFAGKLIPLDILSNFGLENVEPLKLKTSWRKMIMRKLPYGWQRKLRYWLGERGFARIYNWLRS